MVDFDRKRRNAVQKQQPEKVRGFQAKINEALSPKMVTAKLLTRKQRGKLEGPDRGRGCKKERIKEKGKGMTWGQRIKCGEERRREGEKEREEEEGKKRGKEGKEGRKEMTTLAGAPRKGRSTPSQTRAIAFTLQYRTTSCLFCYSLILHYHLFPL